MKTFSLTAILIMFCFGLSQSATAQLREDDAPLTNAAVVKLVKADFKEKTIFAIIGSRPCRFDLGTERMIDLKRSGVSERIILAMLAHQQGVAYDENWSDDAFFNQGLDKAAGNQDPATSKPGAGNSTDIFGSSGSMRGSTESRGANGSASGETITTGSATVRILRPPSEAGGAPKLDRVATLTNDSIVELVEAGFSEGTIIRRIEQSPVEFDLSPARVSDLRKHRVSEKILAAMKTATGDSSDSKAASGLNGTRGR
jgi:hypothetical protein